MNDKIAGTGNRCYLNERGVISRRLKGSPEGLVLTLHSSITFAVFPESISAKREMVSSCDTKSGSTKNYFHEFGILSIIQNKIIPESHLHTISEWGSETVRTLLVYVVIA